MAFVDLHLHTTTSDGVWTPEELFAYVRANGIALFSVTDHDTMDVYPVPADLEPRCIPGIEVDTKCEGVTAHLLCYGISDPAAPLLAHLREQRAARRGRMKQMVDDLNTIGVDVTMAEVERQAGSAASLGRPHLARALVARGAVATVQEAFDRYIADGGDAFVSLDRLESERAIELAHASGAIVSVAHPKRLSEPRLLEALVGFGADAVEMLHPTADQAYAAELEAFALERSLLVTGGSDFHAPSTHALPGVHLAQRHVEALLARVACSA